MPADPARPLSRRRHNCDPERFVNDILAGVDLHDAYELAGFKRPRGNAQRLLREPAVAARFEFLRKEIDSEREQLTALRRSRTRRILEGYRDIDRSSMYNDDGSFKSLKELSSEQRSLIESIEITKFGTKVSMPSKIATAAQLAKLDGLDEPERTELTGKNGAPLPGQTVYALTDDQLLAIAGGGRDGNATSPPRQG